MNEQDFRPRNFYLYQVMTDDPESKAAHERVDRSKIIATLSHAGGVEVWEYDEGLLSRGYIVAKGSVESKGTKERGMDIAYKAGIYRILTIEKRVCEEIPGKGGRSRLELLL